MSQKLIFTMLSDKVVYSDKAYEGAVAAKTGYTRAAGFNGVLLAERSNERIITVVFGGRSTTKMIAQISKLTDLGSRKTPSN